MPKQHFILSKIQYLLLFYTSFFIFSCKTTENEVPDISHIEVAMKAERADKVLLKNQSKEEIKEYLKNHLLFTRQGLGLDYNNAPFDLVSDLYNLSNDPYIDTLEMDCDRTYGDFSVYENEISQVFAYGKFYYPDIKIPKLYTMVTGFGIDIRLTDSLLLIGLDYFLGRNTNYRPPMAGGFFMPDYIWVRHQPEYIKAHVAMHLSERYNQSNLDDATLLNGMITAGKTLFFMERMLPTAPDSLLIGYSQVEVENARSHLSQIWAHFVEKQLFYDNTRLSKQKYIQEAPFTNAIGPECPGRIGTYLGWMIVRAYMKEHPEVTLPDLMKEKDAQKIFNESHFKPILEEE